MATAAAAVNFGPQHSESPVLGLANRVFKRLVETRPASAALEFGLRGEQRQVATGAGEDALAMFLEQRTRTRALGALLAQNFVLLGRELRAPFRVGLFDLKLLRGFRRGGAQPAEGGKPKQSGHGRKQETAVEHNGLRVKRERTARQTDTGVKRGSYTDSAGTCSLSCENRAAAHRTRGFFSRLLLVRKRPCLRGLPARGHAAFPASGETAAAGFRPGDSPRPDGCREFAP